MLPINEQIQSLRAQIGAEYKKPPIEKVNQFIENLASCEEARQYLEVERGLSKDTISYFKLGYDPDKHAISIPIFKTKEEAELVNIKYRFLKPDKIKYTSERGAETWLYHDVGIDKAKGKGGVLIVEGEFDLMSCWQAGIHNVVSPVAGKDSYGVWIEFLDSIPRIYIAYDNDNAGKETSIKLAERLGVDKCLEVCYPDGIKDANEYFRKYTREDYLKLIKDSRPYYTRQFKGVGDIIKNLRTKRDNTVKSGFLPKVKMENGWMVMISGASNIGKTTYSMNIANELTEKGIPTIVFPFERGIESVGRRFLQVKFNKTLEDFELADDQEWDKMIDECINTPIYFALPNKKDVVETIVKAKRIFNTQVVIVDHLDYLIRGGVGSKEAEISSTLQDLKRVAEDNGIILLIITHIRKIEQAGSWKKSKPNIEDLKGSSSCYQDPECVVMLSSQDTGKIDVDVLKNKGEMGYACYGINNATGRMVLEF